MGHRIIEYGQSRGPSGRRSLRIATTICIAIASTGLVVSFILGDTTAQYVLFWTIALPAVALLMAAASAVCWRHDCAMELLMCAVSVLLLLGEFIALARLVGPLGSGLGAELSSAVSHFSVWL